MGTSTNGSESSADTATYPYKNEVSLSIGGDDDSTATMPTPSPRQVSPNGATMEDIPLTKSSPDLDLRKNGGGGFDNPAFDQRPLSSFGQSNGRTDSSSPEKNGKEKPIGKCTWKYTHCVK